MDTFAVLILTLTMMLSTTKLCRCFTPYYSKGYHHLSSWKARSFVSPYAQAAWSAPGRELRRKLTVFKENGGEPLIDIAALEELARQQKLQKEISAFQSDKSRKVFEEKLTFPTLFKMKVIGVNDPSFVSDVIEIIGRCSSIEEEKKSSLAYSLKDTANGKYVSVTVTPLFSDASQLYTTYEELGKDPRVKFVI